MLNPENNQFSTGNYLLDSLPVEVRKRLSPDLEVVQLVQGEMLYPARTSMDYIFFPTTALLSWVATTEDGDRVEVGIMGWDGMAGTQVLLGENILPYQIEVEFPGEVLKIRATILKQVFDQSVEMHRLLLRYIHFGMVQLAQSAVCNRFHTVEARLSRWLLTASDRTNSNELLLTQDTLAAMVGARRPAVSIVLGILQTAGFIQRQRGKINIIDRQGLEAAACECYHVVKGELKRFLAK